MTSQPANKPAEEIVRIESENRDLDEQIRVLTEKRESNVQIVEALGSVAEWREVEDEPEVGETEEEPQHGTDDAN